MTKTHWWTTLSAVGALALTGCGLDQGADAGGGEDGDYPSGTVEVVVPFSAGGPTDTAARSMSSCLEDELDTSFVVVNRAGAAGTIGTSELVQAAPDGHTLGMISTTTAVAAPQFQDDVDYGLDDLQPLALLADIPSVIAVHPESEHHGIEDLIEAAEDSPGSVTVAVPGSSTVFDIEIDRLADEYGVQLEAVPFEGGSEARTAVLGGNVDALWDAASQDLLDVIDEGQFRPLATGSPESVDFIDAPALSEAGYPEITRSNTPFSLAAPAGTPDDVVSELEGQIDSCQQTQEHLAVVGEEFVPNDFVGAQELTEQFNELADLYGSM